MFEQYINSEKTREHYNYLIDKFVKHGQLNSFDSILSINGVDLQKKKLKIIFCYSKIRAIVLDVSDQIHLQSNTST
jgi:hypothetical protein